VRLATVRLATVRLATVRLATVRLATVRLATVRLATVRLATVRLATVRRGSLRWLPVSRWSSKHTSVRLAVHCRDESPARQCVDCPQGAQLSTDSAPGRI
jgi:hypothetical protein